jgi:hypothetical protein
MRNLLKTRKLVIRAASAARIFRSALALKQVTRNGDEKSIRQISEPRLESDFMSSDFARSYFVCGDFVSGDFVCGCASERR